MLRCPPSKRQGKYEPHSVNVNVCPQTTLFTFEHIVYCPNGNGGTAILFLTDKQGNNQTDGL